MIIIDISRPTKEYLAKAGQASFLYSMLLLFGALTVAGVTGTLGYFLLRFIFPDVPVYSAIVIALGALIVNLRWLSVRFSWIMPWYYLLPAIIFLLTFSFLPIILTVLLAFTDYAGTRKGGLNVSSETAITSVSGSTLTIDNVRTFDCDDLRNGCTNVKAFIYASGQLEAEGVSLEGTTLTLKDPIPEGREVKQVGLFLNAVGDRFQFPVSSTNGNTLILENAPAADAVDISSVGVVLDRIPIQRTILQDDNNTLTLNEPLPEGLEYESIARFNAFGFVGWRNFRTIFAQASKALIPVFSWNISFAVLTVLINTVCGVFLAVLLNNPSLRFKALYRTLLIVPWALPNIITIQVWKGFLNQNFGAVNRVLMLLDVTPEPVNWLIGDPNAARAAILLVNLWLGLPFIFTATLGALSAIPQDLYEAAKLDGANAWQSFWGVTGPLLRTALVPITLTGFAFNFNNFNIIFLLTDGGPPTTWGTATARGTDILITWAYNEAFRSQGGFAYGLGSAISILIFIITVAVSLMNFKVTGALKEESNA